MAAATSTTTTTHKYVFALLTGDDTWVAAPTVNGWQTRMMGDEQQYGMPVYIY